MTLTTKKIQTIKPSSKRISISDGNGLTLRVQPSGAKSWVFRQHHSGRVIDETIGHWPEMSLKQARQIVRRRRKEAGLKPPSGYVLNDAFRLWCGLKKGRIVSYREERRRLENHVINALGRKQIDEITAPLIISHVLPIERAGNQATLKRILMRMREIMNLAVCAGYIQHNPLERVSMVFAPPEVEPMPSVHWSKMTEVCKCFTDAPVRTQILFCFSVCSMLRPSENAKLKWSWIENDVLKIPADEMKKRKAFRVPLTPLMLRLLDAAKRHSRHPRSDYVFSGRISGAHVSSQSLAKFLHDSEMSGKLVAHGLRSMARSFLADHQAPFEAAEMCLAHVVGSSVSRAYQRSDYLDVRRDLMRLWSDYFEGCADCAGMNLDFP